MIPEILLNLLYYTGIPLVTLIVAFLYGKHTEKKANQLERALEKQELQKDVDAAQKNVIKIEDKRRENIKDVDSASSPHELIKLWNTLWGPKDNDKSS